MAGSHAVKEITTVAQKTANTFREALQDLLVPEIRSMKVSIDSLRTEMHLRDDQGAKNLDALATELRFRDATQTQNLESLREELLLRDATQTKNLEALREELRLRLDSVREEVRSNAQTLHDELRVRDEKQALAMKNLSDKLDLALDIRERLVQQEARQPARSRASAKIEAVKTIAILGSTGSIGTSTLDICRQYPDRYRVHALAAGTNLDLALQQCLEWRPAVVSMADAPTADALATRLREHGATGIEVVHGTAGTVRVATLPEVDFVVSAIVGVAGLEATFAAVDASKDVGLANKEAMVAAGELILARARETGAAILPIDSEHNAIHQCMRGGTAAEVKQIWLTASGGPFRNTPLAEFARITPAQALKHPTWVMGRRITVDSATMLNKGLEIIEACRLFDLPPEKVRVTVHPQSSIHSLVEFVDGSILAQLSVTDMRLPILYAMAYPERVPSDLTFDLAALAHLDFQQPDFERFPCLRLAYEAAQSGSAACIALNAADEIAVEAFLRGDLPFLGIPQTIEQVLAATPATRPGTIAEVLRMDADARTLAREVVAAAAVGAR